MGALCGTLDPGVAVGDGEPAPGGGAVGDGVAASNGVAAADGEPTAAGVAVGEGVDVDVGWTVTEGSAGGSTTEIAVDVAARSDRVNGVDVATERTLTAAFAIGVAAGA